MAKNIFSRVSRTPATSTHLNTLQHMEFFLSLVKSFRPLINVLKNSVLVVVGVLDTPLISQSCRLQDCKFSKISPWKIFKNFHWRNIAMQCMKAFCRTPLFTNYYFITSLLDYFILSKCFLLWKHIYMSNIYVLLFKKICLHWHSCLFSVLCWQYLYYP